MFSKAQTPDPRLGRFDHVIIHVTATPPGRDVDDRDIDRMHRHRGFSSCGYNALIKRDGTWLDSDMGAVTRPIGNQGAHVGGCGAGWNGRSFGVSMAGGVDEQNRPENNMTDAQFDALEQGIKRFMELHPKGARGVTVMGHRDLIALTNAPKKKACPCFDSIQWWESVSLGEVLTGPDEDRSGFNSLVDQPSFWTVATGDTLTEIIATTGVTMSEILSLNPEIADPDHIAVGQVIRLSRA